jgi:hypothetical protein
MTSFFLTLLGLAMLGGRTDKEGTWNVEPQKDPKA